MINHLKERTWLIDMGQNIILENNLLTVIPLQMGRAMYICHLENRTENNITSLITIHHRLCKGGIRD